MDTLSQSEFARKHGISKMRVTRLKQMGRLVLDDSGKIRESETLNLIRETTDLSKPSFLDRIPQDRAPIADAAQAADPDPMAIIADTAQITSYAEARAIREKYLALSAKQAYERESGDLVPVSDYRHAFASVGIVFRRQLESLAPRLAPELAAELDVARVRALLAEAVEAVLLATSQEFERQAQRITQPTGGTDL